MAARTAAFEFSEKINGCECEGVFRWGKDCLAGKFVLLQKTKDRKRVVPFERMTNGVRIVYALDGRWGLKEESKERTLGGHQNDFRKQKLKGFSFCKDMTKRKYFLR
jgi:hypothetical protein